MSWVGPKKNMVKPNNIVFQPENGDNINLHITQMTYFDTEASVWFTPFSLEFTFSKMLEHVAGFMRDIVLDFTHCVKMPIFSSATCFTFAAAEM
jgi:hypothetical protein